MKLPKIVWWIFLFFIIIRLYFIFAFPPFTDESLFIRWGQLMIHNPAYRWASLSYISRQPLAMWLFGLGAIVTHAPLAGARLVMMITNIPVFFALYALTSRLFSKKTAYISLLLLTATPLFILTQTLAMMDGFLFAISMYLLWIFTEKWPSKIFLSVSAAVLLGIGLWIKSTSLYLIALIAVALYWKRKNSELTTKEIGSMVIPIIILPVIMLLPLFFQKDFANIIHEPSTFIFSFRDIPNLPFTWIRNVVFTGISLLLYLNPVIVLVAACFIPWKKKKLRLLLMWFLIPLAITIFSAKHILTRYYIIGMAGLLPILSYGLMEWVSRISRKSIIWIGISLIGIYGIFFVISPTSYFRMFPPSSQEQFYALSWPSGYGLPELTRFIDGQLTDNAYLLLAVDDSPGNPTDYILAYYYFRPNVHIIFTSVSDETEFNKLIRVASKEPVFLIARDSQLKDFIRPFLAPVKIFPKPYHDDSVGIFRITFAV